MFKFANGTNARFDFYVDNKYVIEFDGPQHAGQISGYFTKEVIQDIQRRDTEKNEYCLKNIARYSMPYEIEYRETLPTTKVGKVAYRELEKEEENKEK